MNPPVPGVDASTKLSGETQSALPAVSMTCDRETPLPRSPPGRPAPAAADRGDPRSETFATPETPISRGTIVQRASTDISIGETVSRRGADHHDPVRRRERLEHLRGRDTFGRRVGLRRRARPRPVGRDRGRCRARRRGRSGRGRQSTRSGCPRGTRPVQQVRLDGNRHQLLDLGRRQPERFRLHLDGRRHELGQDVGRHVAELADPDGQRRRRGGGRPGAGTSGSRRRSNASPETPPPISARECHRRIRAVLFGLRRPA